MKTGCCLEKLFNGILSGCCLEELFSGLIRKLV